MRQLFALLLCAPLLLAGCVGSVDEPLEAAAADDVAADGPVAGLTVDLSFEGETQTGACVGAVVVGFCMVPSGDNIHPLDFEGEPLRLAGEVAWDATTPATSTLGVLLLYKEDNYWTGPEGDDALYEYGSSPLKFDWTDFSEYEGRELALYVGNWQGAGAGAAWTYATVPQAYAITGSITSAAPAPADDAATG